jgi:hypothetical protein
MTSTLVYDSQTALSVQLAERISTDGGFTFSIPTKDLITSGVAVSCHKDRERLIGGYATAEDIKAYAFDNADLLFTSGNCLGAWFDGHVTFLDVTTVVDSVSKAAELGHKYGQLAVFVLDTAETIAL